MSINSRQKGKRIERWFANLLKPYYPNIRRNAGTQSQSGGVDLENTGRFDIEIKGGKQCNSKKIRSWINQAKSEGKKGNNKLLMIKPEREEAYVIIPIEDFMDIMDNLLLNDEL